MSKNRYRYNVDIEVEVDRYRYTYASTYTYGKEQGNTVLLSMLYEFDRTNLGQNTETWK